MAVVAGQTYYVAQKLTGEWLLTETTGFNEQQRVPVLLELTPTESIKYIPKVALTVELSGVANQELRLAVATAQGIKALTPDVVFFPKAGLTGTGVLMTEHLQWLWQDINYILTLGSAKVTVSQLPLTVQKGLTLLPDGLF